ncbi:serine hydrolase domain-containing protein [Paenibacillus sp. OAS669]|uniref:serine hydrolase domain-containing protein n=1 Tax=Paenibacillus sp. OAS669 TaxID=2663821 RepID=UPI00178A9178|nr:serine hydrolase domain-containing protein [Paenibacillus sp. OAS669]MBE1442723.1 CubicO group peptidase (beta-lactamase class C family) [Paenibacillus sp. OAS669]
MTIRYKKISLCLSCLLLVLSFLTKPASAMEIRNKAEIQQEMNDFVVKNMKANHIQGAALAVANNDEVFYAQGYGTFSDGREITGNTPFPIASLSKSFTALAVLQLADKGLIDLDAPFISYFPELSPSDEQVRDMTVRHLLNQTSGLNDKVNPDMTNVHPYRSLQDIKQSLNTVKLAHAPGTVYSYHNPNYQYLALLVERVSGQSFSAYLNNHLFEPLGMNHTFNVSTTQQINENPAIPRGHYLVFGYPVSQAEPLWFVDGPAGMVSTAESMAKWMLAQYSGRLLSPELMKQYHAAGQIGPYGMGWLAEEDEHGARTISHSGIFWTYKAEEAIYLDEQLGIMMMFDTGLNAFTDYHAFIDGIAAIVKGRQAEASPFSSGTMEAFMIFLVIATILWAVYRQSRIRRSRKSITTVRLILLSVGRLFPIFLLLFLSPLTTLIGAGRVVPWFGLWTTMSSLVIWLIVLSLANVMSMIGSLRMYYQAKKRTGW